MNTGRKKCTWEWSWRNDGDDEPELDRDKLQGVSEPVDSSPENDACNLGILSFSSRSSFSCKVNINLHEQSLKLKSAVMTIKNDA